MSDFIQQCLRTELDHKLRNRQIKKDEKLDPANHLRKRKPKPITYGNDCGCIANDLEESEYEKKVRGIENE